MQGTSAADSNINAWLIEDSLYLSPKSSWDVEPLHIRKGSEVFRLNDLEKPLSPSSLQGKGNAIFPFQQRQLNVSIESERRIPFKHGINLLDDFVIDGKKTLSLCLGNEPEPCQINILKNINIHSSHQESLQIRAMLGVHRGAGKLVAELQQDSTTTKHEINFSDKHKGGTEEHKYQKAIINLPTFSGAAKLSIYVEHQSYIPWETTERTDSFYFITDLKITEKSGLPTTISTARIYEGSQGFPNIAKLKHAKVSLFQSSHDAPLEIVWRNGSSTVLFNPLDTSGCIHGFQDGQVVSTSSKAGLHNIYVNNQISTTDFFDTGKTYSEINSHFLNGDPALVEIRDLSGSQVIAASSTILKRALTSERTLNQESKPPFPTDLTGRNGHRYASIRKHLANPLAGSDSAMLSQALATLDRSHDTLDLEYLDIPTQRNPQVSIVIPAHNKVRVTYYCLCSILVAYNKASFEVIVVDDGSTDDTTRLEEIVSGIKIIHNNEPQRFIGACNAGVKAARGEYVVLLNNDTEVTDGWIDELIEGFNRFPNTGAVGSKLLYPDGKLQGAGGIVWGSGNPWNYGTGQNPWDPRFMYARQVDYICGAALMTSKKIWDEVGGLSDYLKPMYFEDTDFSFKVRNAGYKTYYIPSSVIYHHEGLTSGTDTSSGFKRFQEVNRPKFKKTWSQAFGSHGKDGVNPDLEKDRGIVGRVLFIDYTTPREDRDAGSYAAIQEIKLVQSLGYKVTFIPKNFEDFGIYTQKLRNLGVEVIVAPFYRCIEDFIAQRGTEFDCAYITRYYVAQESIPALREYAPDCKIIMNNADLHFLRELRSAGDDPDKLERATEVREMELEMMLESDVVISYNETEHAVIQSHTDNAVNVMKCPWVIDTPNNSPRFRATKGLAFLGGFKHPPNREGVEWFGAEVMPLIEHEGIELSVYGAAMDHSFKTSMRDQGINAVGYIDDLEDVYTKHRIFIAPLLSGAGIKGKVINALAYGIPTILTPMAAEGIGLRHGHDCMIARTPQEWAESIKKLYKDEALWKAISKASREYAEQQFSFDEGRRLMREIFESIELFNSQN